MRPAGDGNVDDDESTNDVVPLASILTTKRSSSWDGESLSAEETAYYKYIGEQSGLEGFDPGLVKAACLLHQSKPAVPAEPDIEAPCLTYTDTSDKVREKIRVHLATYEGKHGLGFGTLNRELIEAGYPSRDSKAKDPASVDDMCAIWSYSNQRWPL